MLKQIQQKKKKEKEKKGAKWFTLISKKLQCRTPCVTSCVFFLNLCHAQGSESL